MNTAGQPPKPFVHNRDTAPAYWSTDILWTMLATSQDTNGRYSALEQLCREGSGPLSHLHMDQDETFYVLDGSLEFRVGDRTFQANAGDFLAIPRWIGHSFRVTSPTARVLNCYFPAGFEQIILQSGVSATERTLPPATLPVPETRLERNLAQRYGMAYLTDSPAPAPPGGAKPFLIRHDTGQAYWNVGLLWVMLAMYEDTAGSYSWMAEFLPIGPAAPPHQHEAAEEIFYLLDGEATFFAGEAAQPLKAVAGSLVSIPRQTRHSFQIDSPTARLLNAYTPAGFEHTIPPIAVTASQYALPPSTLEATNMQRAVQIIAEIEQKYPASLTTVFAADFLNRSGITP